MSVSEKQKGSSFTHPEEAGYHVTAANEDITHDAVFGDLDGNGPNFRAVGWIGATVLMIKSAFGLGVLSIPFVFQAVGIVPGIILIIVIEFIVTWSAFVLGDFKLKHRDAYSMADVGRVLAGRPGEEFFSLAVCICMLFFSASGMVGVTTALNAVSTHGTCTAVFMIVVFIVSFGCATIRTLGNITWLGWVGLMSILSAVLVMTVSVGIQDRPADAPHEGPWDKDFKVFNNPSFADGISAVATILFAAAGTPTYFGIISEMRDPRLYHRAMIINQLFVTCMYIVIGSIVYYYAGRFVAQPALGTAGPLMKKVCYGLSIPGLFFSVILWVHIPAKFIMVRILRGSEHLTKSSVTHWTTWIGCSFACTTIAYIIASAIPMLSSIIALVGALIAPMLCIIPFGFMWFHDNIKGKDKRTMSLKLKLGSVWATFVILVGFFITIAGTYGAIVSIMNQSGGGKPWSCEDNSNSV